MQLPKLVLITLVLSLLLIELSQVSGWSRRRRRRRCPVVNCKVTGWGPWSTCSPDCGHRSQTRNRQVTKKPSCGGKACPSLTQTQNCTGDGNCYNGGVLTSSGCSCSQGFGGTCCRSDINECCAEPLVCQHGCINTYGSYTCVCKSGYKLAADQHSCEDINECSAEPPVCQHDCINTNGSYTCVCKSGYKLAADQHSCEVDAGCNGTYVGCYKDYRSPIFNITLLTARVESSDVYYGKVNWTNYDVWLPRFICACSEKTKSAGFNVFGIQNFGICMTGYGDYTAPGVANNQSCTNSDFIKDCKPNSTSWCTGIKSTNAVYKIED